MRWQVFEGICTQWLARFASSSNLAPILDMGRWWARGSGIEIDLVVRLSDGNYLFAESKWSRSAVDADELGRFKRKVEEAPHPHWKAAARYALFSVGGFTSRLAELAAEQQVLLVGPDDLFRGLSPEKGSE